MNSVLSKMKKNELVFWLSFILMAALYSQNNVGGAGHELPFNVTTWFAVALFIIYSLIKAVNSRKVYLSVFVLWALIFVSVTFGVGVVNTTINTNQIIVEFFVFLVIFLFIFSLFQYQLTFAAFIKILFVLILFGVIQSVIALLQVYDKEFIVYGFLGYAPLMQIQPLGVFQQKNMLAVILSVSSLSGLYVLLRSGFYIKSFSAVAFIFMSALITIYTIGLLESRVGLLSLIVGTIFLFWGNKSRLKSRKSLTVIWLAVVFSSMLSSSYISNYDVAGQGVIEKTANVISGSDVRVFLYKSTIDMIVDAPLAGYGIGSYHTEFMKYVAANGVPDVLDNFNPSIYLHPHNELLFWVFQSGIVVLLVFIVFIYIYFSKLKLQRLSTNVSLFGLMFPLVLSSLVSLPFSISSIHLFLLLFFIYVGVRSSKKLYEFNVTKSFSVFMKITGVFLSCVSMYFTWHTLKSSAEVTLFDNKKAYFSVMSAQQKLDVAYLEHATNNIFYREDSIRAMLFLGNQAVTKNIFFDLIKYQHWAEAQTVNINNIAISELLYKVYIKLDETEKAEQILKSISEVKKAQ